MDATLRIPPRWRVRLSVKASDSSVSARTLRSIMASCSARSRLTARPARPKPALLTTYCGSAPAEASASLRRRTAPSCVRSAAMTSGRGAPPSAIAAASASSRSARRATSARAWPWRANSRANASPRPDGATGGSNDHLIVSAEAKSCAVGRILFQIFTRREVARKDRLLNRFGGIIGPELADLRIGLDDRVDKLAVHARDLADVDVEDRGAVLIESDRPDRAVREAHILHCLEEGRRVVRAAAGGLERLLDDEQRRIGTRGIEAGIMLVSLVDAGNELPVVRRVEAGGIPARAIDADGLLAHHPEDTFVGGRRVAEHRDPALESEIAELFEEA